MNTSRQIALVREAADLAQKAGMAWQEYLDLAKARPGDEAKAIFNFTCVAAETALRLEAKERERRALFERTPVLQARIAWNGNERRIVVAKPNAQIGDPHIPQAFYEAIRRNWSMPVADRITTGEPYEIAVVDRSMRVVATIEKKCYNVNTELNRKKTKERK